MKNLKMIALTGGIGSGKSFALTILQHAEYKTLSCDKITADLYKKRKIKLLLKSMFPTAVKGCLFLKLNRKEISRIVFADKSMHEKLTSTITPLVLEEVKRRARKLGGTVFVEVPLLFECGYEKEFDGVIIIMRNLKDRIESVKKRSNLSEQEIVARINNQFDYENATLDAYIVIYNDNGLSQFKDKVLSVAENFCK